MPQLKIILMHYHYETNSGLFPTDWLPVLEWRHLWGKGLREALSQEPSLIIAALKKSANPVSSIGLNNILTERESVFYKWLHSVLALTLPSFSYLVLFRSQDLLRIQGCPTQLFFITLLFPILKPLTSYTLTFFLVNLNPARCQTGW